MSHKDKAETGFTKSSGNVFADLGLERPEVHRIKADLALRLNKHIDQLGSSQTELAELLGLQQPHVSQLRRYKLKGFSVERLMELLVRLGVPVEIQVGTHRTACAELRVTSQSYEKRVIRAMPVVEHSDEFIWTQVRSHIVRVAKRAEHFVSREDAEFFPVQKLRAGTSDWRTLQ